MLLFVLWIGVGALAGSLVGIYRCSDATKGLPKVEHTLHVGFCASVGALAGFLLFLVLGSLFYSFGPSSN